MFVIKPGKFSTIIFLIFFCLYMILSSFWDSNYVDVQLLDIVPEALFIFLQSFALCYSE